MSYVAFLHQAFEKVPYRDFFEMNPPGTHLLNRLVFAAIGRSALGLRLLDGAWLLAISAFTVATLRPFGWRVGASAACIFAIDYLGLGPLHAFQREYVCVLPIAAALWLALRAAGPAPLRSFGIGVLYGAVATIKPFLAFGIVPLGAFVLAGLWRAPARPRPLQVFACVASAGLGGLVPIAACLAFLDREGALAPFLSMVREYWPLYAELRGDGSLGGGLFERGVLDGLRSVIDASPLVFMAPLGVLSLLPCFADARARREIFTFVGLALVFALYIALAGKFWEYHGLPLFWACALIGGFVEFRRGDDAPPVAWVALRSLTVAVFIWLSLAETPRPALRAWHTRVTDQAESVAAYLSRRVVPHEAIQPLDVANGAVHAMWLVRADLATSFLYDFHFYHHSDSPYIRALQAQLRRELDERKPRFIIVATQPAFRPTGPGSTTFPELAGLLARDYVHVYRAGGLDVLERKGAAR